MSLLVCFRNQNNIYVYVNIIFKESNLFINELIFKWSKINLSGEKFFNYFSPISASMILLQEP